MSLKTSERESPHFHVVYTLQASGLCEIGPENSLTALTIHAATSVSQSVETQLITGIDVASL